MQKVKVGACICVVCESETDWRKIIIAKIEISQKQTVFPHSWSRFLCGKLNVLESLSYLLRLRNHSPHNFFNMRLTVYRRLAVNSRACDPAVGCAVRPAQVHLWNGGVRQVRPVAQRQRRVAFLRLLREELRIWFIRLGESAESLLLGLREEPSQAARLQVFKKRLATIPQQGFQREPLVLAVQELRFGLVGPRVDVVLIQTLELRQSHVSKRARNR